MLRDIFLGLLDLICPLSCAVCGNFSETPLCSICFTSLQKAMSPLCDKCGKPCAVRVESCRDCKDKKFYFSYARSAGLYEGSFKEAIYAFKFRNYKSLAPLFAHLMVERFNFEVNEVDLVTYVPLTQEKEMKRGYNQAELLAVEVAKLLNKPLIKTLNQMKTTEDQSKLKPVERKKNVRGAYQIASRELVQGKSLLLIDDVFTTGATSNECSKALAFAGAEEVMVLTVVRASDF